MESGQLVQAVWKLGGTPGAVRNRDDGCPTIMDDESVTIPRFRVMDEAVRALKSVRMLVAYVLDIGAHHFTAVFCHEVRSHSRAMATMGS